MKNLKFFVLLIFEKFLIFFEFFRFQVFHNYLHLRPGMNMQVCECKPAFVPDDLFVSGTNPYKELQTNAPVSSPSNSESVSTTNDQIQTTQTTQEAPIPGLGALSPTPNGAENQSEAISLLIEDRSPEGTNEKKRKLNPSSTEVPTDKEDSNKVKIETQSQRLKPTIVPAPQDLSDYLGDEVRSHF